MAPWHFNLWLGHKIGTSGPSGKEGLTTGEEAAQMLRVQPAPGAEPPLRLWCDTLGRSEPGPLPS